MRGTPLLEVFDKFLNSIENKELLIVRPEIVENLMLNYLENAVVDFSQCKKGLDFSYPQRSEKTFTINEDTTTIFLEVEDAPSTYIYGITGLESNEEYDYGETIVNTGIEIEIDNVRNEQVIVRYAIEGCFQEELDMEERKILVHGMVLSYTSSFLTHLDNLKQYVTDKDFSKLSGANMLLRLMGLKKSHERDLNIAQGRYAFRDFEGWN